jgi:hypothetical protein
MAATSKRNNVKSRLFKPIWDTMFMVALSYPDKDPSLGNQREFKQFYTHLARVIPCITCRKYIKTKIQPEHPLEFRYGRRRLMKSIYEWKVVVTNKLIEQDVKGIKREKPFDLFIKKYERMIARKGCSISCQ